MRPATLAQVEAVYRGDVDRLRRQLRWWTQDQDLVEDAIQFAFQRALEKRPRVRDEGHLCAWVFLSAKREVWNKRRTRHNRLAPEAAQAALDRLADLVADPAERLEVKDRLAQGLEALAQLKPAELIVFWQRMEGRTYAEIQRELGVSFTWVNRYQVEGRARLRAAAA